MNPLMLLSSIRHLVGNSRADWSEIVATLKGELEDVDQTRNGDVENDIEYVEVPEPAWPFKSVTLGGPVAGSALDTLIATPGVVVSRDFRDLTKWDRLDEYPWRQYGWPSSKARAQSRGRVEWENLTTIVVHTAGATNLHPDRWLGVPSHCAVADDATAVLQHFLNTYLWAAHAANRYSASLEVAGNGGITDEQVPVARALVRYMYETRQEHVEGPMYIAPHRFSHSSRGKDCDWDIWDAVCVWAMDELGLKLGPVVGSGKPLPFPGR